MLDERIWKFTLPIIDRPVKEMPAGARVLSAQMQGGELHVWAICDTAADAKRVRARFAIVGTGNPMPTEQVRFIDTVQDGAFVWHVFLILP